MVTIDVHVARDFNEQVLGGFIVNYHLFLPNPHKCILCNIGGDIFIARAVKHVSPNIIEIQIEKPFKFFLGQGLFICMFAAKYNLISRKEFSYVPTCSCFLVKFSKNLLPVYSFVFLISLIRCFYPTPAFGFLKKRAVRFPALLINSLLLATRGPAAAANSCHST